MATAKQLQILVNDLKSGTMGVREIRELLHHRSPLIRANALEALVSPARSDAELIGELVAVARDPTNASPLMGTLSVAHVAVDCLRRVNSPEAINALESVLEAWPSGDRTDLDWYLSQGVVLSSSFAHFTA